MLKWINNVSDEDRLDLCTGKNHRGYLMADTGVAILEIPNVVNVELNIEYDGEIADYDFFVCKYDKTNEAWYMVGYINEILKYNIPTTIAWEQNDWDSQLKKLMMQILGGVCVAMNIDLSEKETVTITTYLDEALELFCGDATYLDDYIDDTNTGDNIIDITVPKVIAKGWWDENKDLHYADGYGANLKGTEIDFDTWLNDEATADDAYMNGFLSYVYEHMEDCTPERLGVKETVDDFIKYEAKREAEDDVESSTEYEVEFTIKVKVNVTSEDEAIGKVVKKYLTDNNTTMRFQNVRETK